MNNYEINNAVDVANILKDILVICSDNSTNIKDAIYTDFFTHSKKYKDHFKSLYF